MLGSTKRGGDLDPIGDAKKLRRIMRCINTGNETPGPIQARTEAQRREALRDSDEPRV
jgi:hypothetical protein